MKNATQQKVFTQVAIAATLPLLMETKNLDNPVYITFSYKAYEADLAKRAVHHDDDVCGKTLEFLKAELKKAGHHQHQSMSAIAIGESNMAYQVVLHQDGKKTVSFLVPKKFVTHTTLAGKVDIADIKIVGESTDTFWPNSKS